MKGKNDIKKWISFSRKERNGAVIILIVIAIAASVYFYKQLSMRGIHKLDVADSTLQKMEQQVSFFEENNSSRNDVTSTLTADKLFVFNPNTLDKAGWLQMGLSERTTNTILNYISKGGRFRNAEDIRKIWGLKKEEADLLIPFIQIDTYKGYTQGYPLRKIPIIHVNTATAEQWKQLPGIGDVLSQRIVKYRTAIKGFKQVDDVAKVYGIKDSVFQKIKPFLRHDVLVVEKKEVEESQGESSIKRVSNEKVNINNASVKDMTVVGIPYHVAKAIVVYREQHGLYTDIAQIKNIIFINQSTYEKVAPLMTIQ